MSITDSTQKLLTNADMDVGAGRFLINLIIAGIVITAGVAVFLYYILDYGVEISIAAGLAAFIVFAAVFYGLLIVKAAKRIDEVEAILPDFLSLMSSNLRSGLTPDRAFVLAVRSEFGPLEKEIDFAAKEIVSGKSFTAAFRDMSKRIDSEMFSKSVRLIIEGVRSGGNLADLLENTALDIRRFSALRKEISATVRVYELFIIAAAAIGAPLLYAVASFLVDIIAQMKDKMDLEGALASTSSYMPIFGGSADALSPDTVFIFSLAAICVTSFFGALAAGVISKGKESVGYTYVPILIVVSLAVFFVTKFLLEFLLKGIFIF